MTSALKSDPAPSDRKHRRIFTDADKRAIVLETETARCNGLPGGPRAWARHYRPLSMARGAMLRQKQTRKSGDCHCRRRTARDITAPIVLHDLLQPPDGMTAVELDDGRRVFAPIGSNPETVREFRHPIDGDKEMELAFFGPHLGNVDVEEANRISFELLLRRLVPLDIRQLVDAVALQTAVQRRPRQMRDGCLQRIEAITER